MPPIGGPTEPAARVSLLVFLGALLADQIIGGRTLFRPRPVDRGSYYAIQAAQLIALVIALDAPRSLPATAIAGWAWVGGVLLMIVGAAIRIWAVRALGPHFSRDVRVRADALLVTAGPYRWLRHPAYSGAVALLIGMGLAQANMASLLAMMPLPGIAYLWRIRVEEAALTRALGARYRACCSGRARLIPGVY